MISAEVPPVSDDSEDQRYRELVLRNIVHCHTRACLDDNGACQKNFSKATRGENLHQWPGLCSLQKTLWRRQNGHATQLPPVALGREPLQRGGLLHCQPHHVLISSRGVTEQGKSLSILFVHQLNVHATHKSSKIMCYYYVMYAIIKYCNSVQYCTCMLQSCILCATCRLFLTVHRMYNLCCKQFSVFSMLCTYIQCTQYWALQISLNCAVVNCKLLCHVPWVSKHLRAT